MKVLELDKLPANPDYTSINDFLDITDEELWEASKEYSRRMKSAKDPYKAFGLKRELIIEVAKEVHQRNLEWIRERFDPENPTAVLGQLHTAPRDAPVQVLRLLRRHGFKRVELYVWVAATSLLSKWRMKVAMETVSELMDIARDLMGGG